MSSHEKNKPKQNKNPQSTMRPSSSTSSTIQGLMSQHNLPASSASSELSGFLNSSAIPAQLFSKTCLSVPRQGQEVAQAIRQGYSPSKGVWYVLYISLQPETSNQKHPSPLRRYNHATAKMLWRPQRGPWAAPVNMPEQAPLSQTVLPEYSSGLCSERHTAMKRAQGPPLLCCNFCVSPTVPALCAGIPQLHSFSLQDRVSVFLPSRWHATR